MNEPEDELPEPDGPPVEYPAPVRYAGWLWVAVSAPLIAAVTIAAFVEMLRGNSSAGAACLLPFVSVFLWDGWKAARGRAGNITGTAIASLLIGLLLWVVVFLSAVERADRPRTPFDVMTYSAVGMVGLVYGLAGLLGCLGERQLAAWHEDQARHREP